MNRWLRQHVVAFVEAVKQFGRSPGSYALNVLVVAIALSLPFAGFTLLENVRPASRQLAVEPEISIFLSLGTPREQASALAPRIRRIAQDAGGGRLEFISRETALSNLKTRSGLSDALAALGENPLPDGYVLKLGDLRNAADSGRLADIAAQLKALPGVEHVQVDSAWVQRLAAMMEVLRLALAFLAGTLGVVVVAVIFNTIRLQVMTQREEIEICRLFGATDAYICRPFYYTGALLGATAGALALALVALGLHPLNDALATLARLYASEFRLASPGLAGTLALLGMSAGLGFLGALLSVRRHLGRLA